MLQRASQFSVSAGTPAAINSTVHLFVNKASTEVNARAEVFKIAKAPKVGYQESLCEQVPEVWLKPEMPKGPPANFCSVASLRALRRRPAAAASRRAACLAADRWLAVARPRDRGGRGRSWRSRIDFAAALNAHGELGDDYHADDGEHLRARLIQVTTKCKASIPTQIWDGNSRIQTTYDADSV